MPRRKSYPVKSKHIRVSHLQNNVVITVVILFSQLSEHLGISMELGCFMAGVVLSSNGEHLVHQVYTLLLKSN